jgi:hypothetical protein
MRVIGKRKDCAVRRNRQVTICVRTTRSPVARPLRLRRHTTWYPFYPLHRCGRHFMLIDTLSRIKCPSVMKASWRLPVTPPVQPVWVRQPDVSVERYSVCWWPATPDAPVLVGLISLEPHGGWTWQVLLADAQTRCGRTATRDDAERAVESILMDSQYSPFYLTAVTKQRSARLKREAQRLRSRRDKRVPFWHQS